MRDGACEFFRAEGSAGVALPRKIEEAMADIAFVFHWTPECMGSMELAELMTWQALAVKRFNTVNTPPDGKA